jgi:hypothetical protein
LARQSLGTARPGRTTAAEAALHDAQVAVERQGEVVETRVAERQALAAKLEGRRLALSELGATAGRRLAAGLSGSGEAAAQVDAAQKENRDLRATPGVLRRTGPAARASSAAGAARG